MTQDMVNVEIAESARKNAETLFENFNFEDVVQDIVNGRFSLEGAGLLNKITALFLGELKTAFALVGTVAALVLLSALVNNLNKSFANETIKEASGFFLFVYIATIVATAFESAGKFVMTALEDITVFVHSIIPAITTLCISSGEFAGATLSHPVIFFVCSAAAWIIRNIITPLVLLRAVCTLLCAITSNNGLNEFTELFSKLHKTLLSFSMSILQEFWG